MSERTHPPSSSRPHIIGLTMGDPAGIGAEVIVKALSLTDLQRGNIVPVVIGDAARLRHAAEICNTPLNITAVQSTHGLASLDDTIWCVDLGNVEPNLPFGRVDERAGRAAYEYIATAVELTLAGELDALCTLPINKEALQLAGYPYPGHSELLAALTDTAEVSMMLDAGRFRVVHVTTHIGLLEAIEKIEPELVLRTIRRAHQTTERTNGATTAIAVCAINPHAGENGLFGHGEEAEKIAPAIERARQEGIDAIGPLPADTAFFRANRGDFSTVVAMYHDQGHAPVKVLGIENAVNVTLGLPIIRTSVDHGTAFDIAGTGVADQQSLLRAVQAASMLI